MTQEPPTFRLGSPAVRPVRADTARACANWWAMFLVGGKHEDKAIPFLDALKARLMAGEFGEREQLGRGGACIGTDWDPSGTLLAALQEVGIECRGFMFSARDIFPTKALMWIRPDGSVSVKEGYGGRELEMLPAYEPPPQPRMTFRRGRDRRATRARWARQGRR